MAAKAVIICRNHRSTSSDPAVQFSNGRITKLWERGKRNEVLLFRQQPTKAARRQGATYGRDRGEEPRRIELAQGAEDDAATALQRRHRQIHQRPRMKEPADGARR